MRSAVVDAIEAILDGPVVTHASGVAGGQRVEIVAAADPGARSMRLDEDLDDTIRTQFVVTDGVLYGNIFPIGQDRPPFTVSELGDFEADFLALPYTASGRVFGEVATLVAVIDRADATIYDLGVRSAGDGEQTGYRFAFDAADVGSLLRDEGLERTVLLPPPGQDTTVIELWFDDRLREIRTSGSMYQDGELIDEVELVIEFEPTDDPDITVPDDTLPN